MAKGSEDMGMPRYLHSEGLLKVSIPDNEDLENANTTLYLWKADRLKLKDVKQLWMSYRQPSKHDVYEALNQ